MMCLLLKSEPSKSHSHGTSDLGSYASRGAEKLTSLSFGAQRSEVRGQRSVLNRA